MTFQILQRCTTMWGKASLKSIDPDISYHSDVLYLPYPHQKSWGIYDRVGNLIEDAADYHGPNGVLEGQRPRIDPAEFGVPQEAPEDAYLYGGFLNPHFGHFIVNSLSRQWVNGDGHVPPFKILWHGPANPQTWFRIPFIKVIFEALGLAESRFVTFDKPTRIPRLMVPHPSFMEQHHVHAAFGRLCRRIGRSVVQRSVIEERAIAPDARPTFLSKAALASGVGRIANENTILEVLTREGVDIVFPERLTFADQVRIFAERENICGMAGSAMHTHAFWRSSGAVSILNATDGPNSNFFLIDLAGNLSVDYVFAPGSRVVEEPERRFLTSIEMAKPEQVASDILSLFNIQAKRGRMRMV